MSRSNDTFDAFAYVQSELMESAALKTKCAETLSDAIAVTGQLLIETVRHGNKILVFGNGGSAADAQHLAGELVGRFNLDRAPLPAIALSTDSSVLTCISNDYGYEHVFARQVEALGRAGDLAIGISTSGDSMSVLRAVRQARATGLKTIGMTGEKGGALRAHCDFHLGVPSQNTARIQEVHVTIIHAWCTLVDNAFSN